MGKLIDADVLKKDLTRFYDGKVSAMQLIDEQPAIVLPQKGYWIPAFDGKCTGGTYWFVCSHCGHIVSGGLQSGKYFCEKCGYDNRGAAK